jgi:hypothetical protein
MNIILTILQMDRENYLREYRAEHRAYFNEKSKQQYELNKALYGRQARVATRKWFVDEPVRGITVERKKIIVSFD